MRVGKSTFAQILLRMLEFDEGDLFINGVDIRRLDPAEYHSHIMAVLQSFSKYSTTVKENVGIGFVKNLGSPKVIEKAVRLAGANSIVDSLPSGLRTKLDTSGFDSTAYPPFPDASKNQVRAHMHHGLSGGEVKDLLPIWNELLIDLYCSSGSGLHYLEHS
jgi:ABC-type oligopeptide transport system ATPase subunit